MRNLLAYLLAQSLCSVGELARSSIKYWKRRQGIL